MKFIPVEVVGSFVFADSILRSSVALPWWIPWAVFAGFLVLSPFVAWVTWLKERDGDPKLQKLKSPVHQAVIAPLAFVVWVLALGGPFVAVEWYNAVYGGLLLAFFTLLAPVAVYVLQRPNGLTP